MPRNYLDSDLKILWGQAGGLCAFPDCRTPLVLDATDTDPRKVVGEIAHVVADSNDGPRSDPSMPAEARRREPNLILLCRNHHAVVDGQPNTYSSADLRRWKVNHLDWVRARLTHAAAEIGFAELQRLTDALVAQVAPSVDGVPSPTAPPEKLSKNCLTIAVANRLRIGSLRFVEVQDFVARASQSDGGYGERLRIGFRDRYDVLVNDGATGDLLFEEILDWASGGSTAFDVVAAALSVVTYLFIVCDLFDP